MLVRLRLFRRLFRPRSRRRGLLLGIGVSVALGALFLSLLAMVSPWSGGRDSSLERIGYFADWNMANEGYRVKDVDDNGAAAQLTMFMWAFGDVNVNGQCGIPEMGNHAWELYQRRYSEDESVSGEPDEYDQPLAGGLNQLSQLRDKYPDMRAGISLGGWNWSRYFSDAARTPESREAFARSCVDLWLRGNLPVRDDEPQGGDGAAEGLFDGIDIDWEWPAGDGHPDNISRPEDRRNFTLMLAELRSQIDAYAEETGRELFLTASFPADEDLMRRGVEPEAFRYLDYSTVQGFDFTGPWSDVTGHHSQLYTPPDSPDEPSVDAAVQRYLDHGVPPERLLVGLAAFGRGWAGVPPENDGRFVTAEESAQGEYGGPGGDAYATLERREGERFFDEERGAYWTYDGDQWWTYDSPEVIEMKADYIIDHGLGGATLWTLDQDRDAELATALARSLR